MTFDDIRAAYPHLGFNVYAMDAGEVVTLEAIGVNGETWSWAAPTLAAAIAKAFPSSVVPQVPLGAGSSPARQATAEGVDAFVRTPESGGTAETTGSVFD